MLSELELQVDVISNNNINLIIERLISKNTLICRKHYILLPILVKYVSKNDELCDIDLEQNYRLEDCTCSASFDFLNYFIQLKKENYSETHLLFSMLQWFEPEIKNQENIYNFIERETLNSEEILCNEGCISKYYLNKKTNTF